MTRALGGSITVQSESNTGSESTAIIQSLAVNDPFVLTDGHSVTELMESDEKAQKWSEETTRQLEEAKVVMASQQTAAKTIQEFTQQLDDAHSRLQS